MSDRVDILAAIRDLDPESSDPELADRETIEALQELAKVCGQWQQYVVVIRRSCQELVKDRDDVVKERNAITAKANSRLWWSLAGWTVAAVAIGIAWRLA